MTIMRPPQHGHGRGSTRGSSIAAFGVSGSADADQALKDAREIGHAATLMYALQYTSLAHVLCGRYATAKAQSDELVALADEKGAPYFKAHGMLIQGWLFSLTGRPSDAIQMLTSGVTAFRLTGATVSLPLWLSHLARAYAELGQFDDAWRCIAEAMTTMETTKERWCEAEILRMAGEIALLSPKLDAAKTEA
jgi:predicted ATPase